MIVTFDLEHENINVQNIVEGKQMNFLGGFK